MLVLALVTACEAKFERDPGLRTDPFLQEMVGRLWQVSARKRDDFALKAHLRWLHENVALDVVGALRMSQGLRSIADEQPGKLNQIADEGLAELRSVTAAQLYGLARRIGARIGSAPCTATVASPDEVILCRTCLLR